MNIKYDVKENFHPMSDVLNVYVIADVSEHISHRYYLNES